MFKEKINKIKRESKTRFYGLQHFLHNKYLNKKVKNLQYEKMCKIIFFLKIGKM